MVVSVEPTSLSSALMGKGAAFDVSHFGALEVSGEDALDLLNRLSTNDLEKLEPGRGMGTTLTTNKGRVIDLLRVLRLDDSLLVLTSPQTQQRVAEWIDFYTFVEDVSVEDVSERTGQTLVVGSGAAEALAEAGFPAESLTEYLDHVATADGARAARVDFGRLPAYLIVAPRDAMPEIGLDALGEDDLERLRVEQAVPAYPAELNEDRNPLEANLKPYISFNKGCYIGQEVVARLNTYDRVQRFLCRLDVADGAEASPGDALMVDGSEVGEVTTAAPGIALGYLRKRHYEDGAEVDIASGDGMVRAVVRDVRPPEDGD